MFQFKYLQSGDCAAKRDGDPSGPAPIAWQSSAGRFLFFLYSIICKENKERNHFTRQRERRVLKTVKDSKVTK